MRIIFELIYEFGLFDYNRLTQHEFKITGADDSFDEQEALKVARSEEVTRALKTVAHIETGVYKWNVCPFIYKCWVSTDDLHEKTTGTIQVRPGEEPAITLGDIKCIFPKRRFRLRLWCSVDRQGLASLADILDQRTHMCSVVEYKTFADCWDWLQKHGIAALVAMSAEWCGIDRQGAVFFNAHVSHTDLPATHGINNNTG